MSAFISPPATYFSCHHFLPFPSGQTLASRLTAYFRKKCVVVTDQRVRLMNEILGCIKFIKMYCWEDAFAQNIQSEFLSRQQMKDSAASKCRDRFLYLFFFQTVFKEWKIHAISSPTESKLRATCHFGKLVTKWIVYHRKLALFSSMN